MSGNQYQYNPAEMFKEWIQKSGKAQAEFMKNFGDLMQQNQNKFDPLVTLQEVASKTSEAQENMMQNMNNMQSKGFEQIFQMNQNLPNFLNWGAYKTTVGSNGRISIPEAERDALGIKEGDLIQVVILPILKKSTNKEVKQ
ncbi:MAG: AbrB/MazE/SpoVT family DNA-binding domain-containing protein [Crenarchaeota archaeon]|nr:MAG: AbrB/MazE/SpoVT family DNA-binding domain-containing protein [Thermoproteota archaeon]RDJ32834.1 MAG: AbrB/MazE/SpoVT family DNA-binding domain-containing protein [Thermoproteota archaeon]RDJ38002.1 MAG: AbrB/MazE/SpoVT family DNA-binding domain-containing protein [Thermoproteota archaeon]RDJ38334.1 MAG: AbrB/MazE/SpoVT family DNA-binding domain-containing protein [Thermoproteota archaeon]